MQSKLMMIGDVVDFYLLLIFLLVAMVFLLQLEYILGEGQTLSCDISTQTEISPIDSPKDRSLWDTLWSHPGAKYPNYDGFIWLYYTKLGLGTPAKDFYVQVDTGSDILWVNCVGCTACPKKSGLGMDLTLYDPNGSKTSKAVSCDDDYCTSTYDGPISGCKQDMSCPYSITYGDGSTTAGSFVNDSLTFNQVNGNLQTAAENSSVVFGCGAKQSGTLGSSSDEALDGIIGFGQSNSSVLSQLAASGKVKRIFSHCLDSINGGGTFSIGEVVEPKFNTTPL
ncbi:aspartic proteinase-like protein 2-like, partial [Trifolium medium]|nr:aspartic proteinase-like protein 2-like [Trifolium medium]